MLNKHLLLLWPAAALASLTIQDPSNVINPKFWKLDNALVADYDIAFVSVQPEAIPAATTIEDKSVTASHTSYSAKNNDTSALLIANGATFTGSYIDILKTGYSTNLNWASFYGFNAAINVANASTATLDHINVTVHNGAANIYAYGTDTAVKVTNAWLYSSGPVSHGLYASGNGTIIAHNVVHYSGGKRSSSFSGDSPKGDIYVYDSIAHSAGIGSATYYALGTIEAYNVLSSSENGPVVFSDGAQNVTLVNCVAKAGLLGGVVMFSSATRLSGAFLNLTDTKITTTGKEMPALWFGNVIAEAYLANVELETESGVLVSANYSQVTQDFDYYASYEDNSSLQPAEVTVRVTESDVTGDLVAYNGSSIGWTLNEYSSWTGAAYSGYKHAYFDVGLDSTSSWTLTADTTVRNFTNAVAGLSNVHSKGHTLFYNSTVSTWLKGKTIKLAGGGEARPITTGKNRIRGGSSRF